MGWRDLIGDVSSKTVGPASPVLAPLKGMYCSWFFKPGNKCYLTYHIPHDYKLGTDLHIHVHWTHNGEEISGNFELEHNISYAKGHYQECFVDEMLILQNIKCDGIKKYTHCIDEILLPKFEVEPDAVITNGLIIDKIPKIIGDQPYPTILCVDLHYESTDESTINKEPDFYN